mgnify:FL=1
MNMIKKIASFLLVVFLLVTLTVSVGAQELNLGFPEETTGENTEEPVLEDSENDLSEDSFDASDGEDISEEIQPEETDDQDISLEEEPEGEEASAEPEEDGLDESEEDVFHDSEQEELFASTAARAANSNIAVKKINSSYNLDEDYAFAYGYRKGKTTLTVQNGSASLLTRLDKQFGIETPRKGLACDLSGTSESGKYVARYTNVGDYLGNAVDLRITVTRWTGIYTEKKGEDGTFITPSIVFYSNRIGANIIAVKRVNFKFDFLKTGTNQKINLKCHMTIQDIDDTQSVRFFDHGIGQGEPTQVYLSQNNYLTVERGDGCTDIISAEGKTDSTDHKAWVQVDYEKELLLGYDMGDSFGRGKGNSILFLATPAVLGQYRILSPIKRIGERGQSYKEMELHNSMDSSKEIVSGKEFDYVIEQRILPGIYGTFIIRDALDPCLTYQGAEITTLSGYNVTKKFDISHDKKTNILVFQAQNSFLSSEEAFNDVTYLFRIKVKAGSDRTIVDHGHNDGRAYWYMKNNATRLFGTASEDTNNCWVKGRVTGSYFINKVDECDHNIQLKGAEFMLEQWDNTVDQYVDSGKQIVFNEETGLYETGLLKRTKTNEGKFRITETKAPEGYICDWSKKFNLMDLPSESTITAENQLEKLLEGKIQITKRILEKDIVWAHGNPVFRFVITGKDARGTEHSYEDYVEFKEGSYFRVGDYAWMICTVTGIPEGTYTISEKETLRYRFKSITATSENMTVSGKSGTAVLERKNLNASVVFENEKTRFDGYSHTDVIRNVVPLQ